MGVFKFNVLLRPFAGRWAASFPTSWVSPVLPFLLYHKSGDECLVFFLKVWMHGEEDPACGVFADGKLPEGSL
jgi:hypothetical protein